jgi:hypothetical protein
VVSAEDLIRAFEYLSVLKLGPEARHWNHRTIAAGLGGGEAAGHLADLYERARYAEPAEPLDAEALPAVRRELTDLAGVAVP